MAVFEKAPAKINLSLDVLGKRPDGYHEVEMVMTTVDLADRLEIEELPRDEIVISSQNGHIPLDEKNLAYQAARLVKERCGIARGVRIRLEKRIPIAAGLAGGSSDAAAVLRGLNRLWGLGLGTDELCALGEAIGSDVPFCVAGGTAVARGRGERLEPIPPPPRCWVVLAKPPIHVSTADIYGRLDLSAIGERPDTQRMIAAIQSGDFAAMCRSLGNVLQEVTMRLHPEVRRIRDLMLRLGADGALMSGSGPTVFALVGRQSKAAAISSGLRGFCKEVHVVRLLAK
jgi:4-diphosphocytidyl-2-C-methyl-D-erythritol kinase